MNTNQLRTRRHQNHQRRRSSSSCSVQPTTKAVRRTRLERNPRDLASLRFIVLSHIEEIERRLQTLDSSRFQDSQQQQPQQQQQESRSPTSSPPPEDIPFANNSDDSVATLTDDFETLIQEGMKRLQDLKAEVASRLPDLDELRSRFPDFDFELPNLEELRNKFKDIPTLSDVRSRFGDLGFDYVPTLQKRLHSLQSHFASIPSLSSLAAGPNGIFHDLLDTLLSSDFVEDLQEEAKRAQSQAERAAAQVTHALKRSLNGTRLITYPELPDRWHNNEWVQDGYRFMPEVKQLIFSIFSLHNETANIFTHLIPLIVFIPCLLYGWWRYSEYEHLPTTLFSVFASSCLLLSVMWHTCAGSSDEHLVEFTARADYVGIGWLISASIASVVYYAFSCQRTPLFIYLSLNLASGISGNIFPFMHWFNQRKHRKWRIVFFLTLGFTCLAPITHMAFQWSTIQAIKFIAPVLPSVASYLIGLTFYATHFPECYVTRTKDGKHWTDWLGGGSHAIWHVFIIIAILQHRSAIPKLIDGVDGSGHCQVWGT